MGHASSDGKESACSAGGPGSIPGWRQSPGGGRNNPLQYSCLENPVDTGAWQVQSMGPRELDVTEQMSLWVMQDIDASRKDSQGPGGDTELQTH